ENPASRSPATSDDVVALGSAATRRAHAASKRSDGVRSESSPRSTAAAVSASDVDASRIPQASEQYESRMVDAVAAIRMARGGRVSAPGGAAESRSAKSPVNVSGW